MLLCPPTLASVKLAPRAPAVCRRVLGIDPGTNVLGYAVVEQTGAERKLILLGTHMAKGADAAQKLSSIYAFLHQLIARHHPTECALEAPFFGKNVQSMLKLGRAQGVAMAVAMGKGLPVTEYAPKKVKMSVTGNGNASKEQVAEMACQLLAFDRQGMKLDATDAVATAICHLNQSTTAGATTGSNYNGWAAFVAANPQRAR